MDPSLHLVSPAFSPGAALNISCSLNLLVINPFSFRMSANACILPSVLKLFALGIEGWQRLFIQYLLSLPGCVLRCTVSNRKAAWTWLLSLRPSHIFLPLLLRFSPYHWFYEILSWYALAWLFLLCLGFLELWGRGFIFFTKFWNLKVIISSDFCSVSLLSSLVWTHADRLGFLDPRLNDPLLIWRDPFFFVFLFCVVSIVKSSISLIFTAAVSNLKSDSYAIQRFCFCLFISDIVVFITRIQFVPFLCLPCLCSIVLST